MNYIPFMCHVSSFVLVLSIYARDGRPAGCPESAPRRRSPPPSVAGFHAFQLAGLQTAKIPLFPCSIRCEGLGFTPVVSIVYIEHLRRCRPIPCGYLRSPHAAYRTICVFPRQGNTGGPPNTVPAGSPQTAPALPCLQQRGRTRLTPSLARQDLLDSRGEKEIDNPQEGSDDEGRYQNDDR